MLEHIKSDLQACIHKAFEKAYPGIALTKDVQLEVPSDSSHGDLSTNIALKSAKACRQAPAKISENLVHCLSEILQKDKLKTSLKSVDIKGPGFINFFFSEECYMNVLEDILAKKDLFGKDVSDKNLKILIEFVSANPTGPLSVAHARQAVVGDALANILCFLGFDARKEYYVNDGGNQINILGRSLKMRAIESFGETVTFPEDGYQGEYIKDMARLFIEQHKIGGLEGLKRVEDSLFSQWGCEYLLNVIRDELEEFRVLFDFWTRESEVATRQKTEDIIKEFQAKDLVYEKEGALWFRSTQFGDDKDRVVKKSDGSFTYLAPDIVYHKNKFDRKFDTLVNIWGPDHHGYIPRIKAAAQALDKRAESIKVLIVQLATIYRDGEALSMSTRKGQYISLREVIDEVGVDAARFFFLMRHINVHLDFDLEVAKRQTAENPVYYIQYAHARINSIYTKAQEAKITAKAKQFSRIHEEEEIRLIQKMGEFPDALKYCHQQFDPYPLVNYLQELAMSFHKFYDHHRVIVDDADLASERLGLIQATRIVLANGLKLLGVSVPDRM